MEESAIHILTVLMTPATYSLYNARVAILDMADVVQIYAKTSPRFLKKKKHLKEMMSHLTAASSERVDMLHLEVTYPYKLMRSLYFSSVFSNIVFSHESSSSTDGFLKNFFRQDLVRNTLA